MIRSIRSAPLLPLLSLLPLVSACVAGGAEGSATEPGGEPGVATPAADAVGEAGEGAGEGAGETTTTAPSTALEERFLELHDDARASAGLPALATYWDLSDDARAHAARMRAAGRIFHQDDLAVMVQPEVWTALGENVGVGGDPESIFDAFMRSAGHRANVLGDYDYIGVGVASADDGRIYVAVEFMRSDVRGLDRALPPFVDDEGSVHEPAIHALWEAGVTHGCGDGTRFCPEAEVTRAQMAAFLVRAFGLPASASDPFVDDEGHWAEADIQALAASGITTGCTADRFCPERSVTRAQMAVFLDRALSLAPASADHFVDDEGHWAEPHIDALAESGITRGCDASGDRFCPEGVVTRSQMASFLARALGLL